MSRGASELILQVDLDELDVYNESDPLGNATVKRQAVIYEVVEYINGIQRPLIKTPDGAGRIRVVKS